MSELSLADQLENIDEILEATPELKRYPPEHWKTTHDFLKREGFSTRKFVSMISLNPKLLSTPREKLFASINSWRMYQFGDDDTMTLLEQHPELISLHHNSELLLKMGTIKEYVGGGNLVKLLINSPVVLADSLPRICEKIDYFKDVMKVEAVQVYKSRAMSCDLHTISTRHNFLKRLGLYIPKKKKEEDANSKNPLLCKITDSSDRKFAAKVCHVTLEEYEVFQEMYRKEVDVLGDAESSDEEDYGHLEHNDVIDLGLDKQ